MEVEKSADARSTVRDKLSWKIVPLLLVTALVVYALVGQLGDVDEFAQTLSEARLEWMLLSVALMAVTVVLNGWRFQVVLAAGDNRISIGRAVKVVLTVWPLVLVIPARANDLLRALALRDEVEPFSCLGSVVAERFIDVQTLCLLGMAGCAVLGAWTWFAVFAALWVAGWAAVVLTVTNVERLVGLPVARRFETKLRALFEGFEGLRRSPRYLAAVVGVSTAAWLSAMANLWLLSWIFGAGLSVAAILGLWPLALFVGMLPVTIGGMGTRDAAFLGLVALTAEEAVAESAVLAASFGYGLVLVILPGVVGIPLMVRWMAGKG